MSLYRNLVGTPSDPQFVEVIARGQSVLSDTSIKQVLNVFNLRRLDNSPAFDPTNVAAAMAAALQAAIIAAMNVRYTLTQWECRGLDDPAGATGVQPAGVDGDITTDSYDNASAVFMLLKTGYRGRSFQGSKHFTPLNEVDTVKDDLSGAGLTRWQAVATAIAGLSSGLADSDGNTWYLTIVSRTLSTLDTLPAVFTGADVSEVALCKTVGTMRRRKEKGVY